MDRDCGLVLRSWLGLGLGFDMAGDVDSGRVGSDCAWGLPGGWFWSANPAHLACVGGQFWRAGALFLQRCRWQVVGQHAEVLFMCMRSCVDVVGCVGR